MILFLFLLLPLSAEARKFPWIEQLRSDISSRLPKLNHARDLRSICPGYDESNQNKVECWTSLSIAMISCESSSFSPKLAFCEERYRKGNRWYFKSASQCRPRKLSVGLWSLSIGECPGSNTVESLKNGPRNLTCGLDILSRLVVKTGSFTRGARAYWGPTRVSRKYSYIVKSAAIYKNGQNRPWRCP